MSDLNEQALLVLDSTNSKVSFTAEALRIKDEALSCAALVGKVSSPAENAAAVEAQRAIAALLGVAEKSRKSAKEPLLKAGKAIDDAAKLFVEELNEEQLRLGRLVGSYQQVLQQQARAEEALRKKELDEQERKRQEALAAAKTHEQIDAIQEHFNTKAAEVCSLPLATEQVRAAGQVVTRDWEVTVTSPRELALYHPECVTITPRMKEIKEILKQGREVRGVRATEIVKAGVRASKVPEAIPV